MADNNTEFGILVRAVDQATSTLKSVAAELERLQRSTNQAQKGADGLSSSGQKLGGVLSSVQQQLNKVNPAMGQMASQMGEIVEAGSGAGGILAAAAAGLAAIGISAVVAANSIADYQEKMDIAGEITGLTQSQIGGLTVELSNVGRSFDSIQPSLIIFNRKLEEAKDGSGTAAQAFQRLKGPQGELIDITKSTSDVFDQVIRSLAKIPDSSERARLAFQLFGRGGSSILTILNQNLTESEKVAEKLGIVLSPAAQKVARDADAVRDHLRLSFTGMMNSITVALAPLGTTLIGLVDKFVQSLRGMVEALNGVHTAAAKVHMESAAAQLDLIGQSADRNEKHVKALKDELIRLQMQQREGGFQTPDLSNVKGFNPKDPRLVPGKVSTVAPSPDAGPLSQYIVGLFQVKGATEETVKSAKQLTDEQLAQLTATKKQIEQLAQMVSLGAIDKVQEYDTLASMRGQSMSKENLIALQDGLNAITGDYLSLQHSAKYIEEQDLKTIRDAGFALNDQIRTLDRKQKYEIISLDAEIATLEAKKASVETAKQLLQVEEKIAELLQKKAALTGYTPIKPFGGSLPTPEGSSPEGPPPKEQQFPELPPADFMDAFSKELRKIAEESKKAGGAMGEFGKELADLIKPFIDIKTTVATMGKTITTTFVNGFGEAARSLVSGTVNIEQAFLSLAQTMIQAIAEIAAKAAATGLIAAIAPALGPAGIAAAVVFTGIVAISEQKKKHAAQQGGTLMQSGGTLLMQSGGSLASILPMFQSQYNDFENTRRSGLVVSGARGADTVPIMAGRGETVLSHDLTDLNSRVMRRMDSFMDMVSKGGLQTSSSAGPTIHEFHFHGQFMDRNSLRQFAEEELVPLVKDIENRGSHRNVG